MNDYYDIFARQSEHFVCITDENIA